MAGYVNEYRAVLHILPSLAPHLFPDNFNGRISPRVVLGIPIQFHRSVKVSIRAVKLIQFTASQDYNQLA